MNLSTHRVIVFFFFNDTATTEIYTLSLHDALPIFGAARARPPRRSRVARRRGGGRARSGLAGMARRRGHLHRPHQDRKSTRLNSSHANISYAVFCLKKKKKQNYRANKRNIYEQLVQ